MQFRVGVEESVGKKWKVKEAFEGFWLATSNDNFYTSSGAISVPAHPGASRHIGNEVDLVCEYEFNKGLNFGLGHARLFAGQFLKTTTPGHDYSYPYAYVEYNFSKERLQQFFWPRFSIRFFSCLPGRGEKSQRECVKCHPCHRG